MGLDNLSEKQRRERLAEIDAELAAMDEGVEDLPDERPSATEAAGQPQDDLVIPDSSFPSLGAALQVVSDPSGVAEAFRNPKKAAFNEPTGDIISDNLDRFAAGLAGKPTEPGGGITGFMAEELGKSGLEAGVAGAVALPAGMVGTALGGPVGGAIGAIGGAFVGGALGSINKSLFKKGLAEIDPAGEDSIFKTEDEFKQAMEDAFESGKGMAAFQSVLGAGAGITSYFRSRLPSIGVNWFLTPQQATKRALESGAKKFTRELADEGIQENLLEGIQKSATLARRRAGNLIERVENELWNKGKLGKKFDVSDITQKLKESAEKANLIGSLSDIRPGPAKTFVSNILKKLEHGKMTGRDLIKIKREIDDMVTWVPGQAAVGPKGEAILKKFRKEAGDMLKDAFPELRKAYEDFAEIAKKYDMFSKEIGLRRSSTPVGPEVTLRRLKGKLFGTRELPRKRALAFDEAFGTFEGRMSKLFDSMVAEAFTAGPVLNRVASPSSLSIRGLATLGFLTPVGFRQLLKLMQGTSSVARSVAPVTGPTARVASRDPNAFLEMFKEIRGQKPKK